MSLKNNTTSLQEILDTINALPNAGMDLPELSNPASSGDILASKEAIDQNGNLITGNIETKDINDITVTGPKVNISSGYYGSDTTKSVETTTQATPDITVSSSGLITASTTQAEGYVEKGTKISTKQLATQAEKTVTPSTSEQTVVNSGVYTTGVVKVAAMPTVSQATPSIEIDSNGLITASAEQSAGYVQKGTKSSTKQLDIQGVKSITPSKQSQTAITSGVYTTGETTVLPIPDEYVVLPALENEGTASDLLAGTQLIDSSGNIIEGTIDTKTSSDLTVNGATVITPAGYYTSQVSKSVSTVEQAIPSITVSNSGLITASSIQAEGYVESNKIQRCMQLNTLAPITITPSTDDQLIASANTFTTGDIKVAAVPVQTKTITPTVSTQTVTPDNGKFLSSVTVNALPVATKNEPSLTIDEYGEITATFNISAGYIETATSQHATKQLQTQPSTTIIPSNVSQTAVNKNIYTTGTITVGGDSNLVPENIKNGIAIFGVTGTCAGGASNLEIFEQEDFAVLKTVSIDNAKEYIEGSTGEYYYYDGMTWEDWVNSEFNTDEFYIEPCEGLQSYHIATDKIRSDYAENNIIYADTNPGGSGSYYTGDVPPSDLIKNSYRYYLSCEEMSGWE